MTQRGERWRCNNGGYINRPEKVKITHNGDEEREIQRQERERITDRRKEEEMKKIWNA